jgi:TonB-dependent SusC/RagA subfamily outer membrane receptor
MSNKPAIMKWNISFLLIIALSLSQLSAGQTSSKKSDKLIIITGKVLNTEKEPVAGAAIYIDNIPTNNTTKGNGTYKIKVSPTALKIEIRSSVYGSREIAINGQTSIDFIFDAPFTAIKSGGNAKETQVPDSLKKPARSRGKKMITYNDIYQMIRVEVPGVIVNGRSIQIQQGHSFFGSSTPLFTVNGVIVPSIDNVNPVEVKSISVLKGSAAAIYGVNGTNGVICIVLKNGTEK